MFRPMSGWDCCVDRWHMLATFTERCRKRELLLLLAISWHCGGFIGHSVAAVEDNALQFYIVLTM